MSRHQQRPMYKSRSGPEKIEVTLVWRDGSKTQALVPVRAPEVTCGKSRFKQDPEHATRYIEI